MIRVMQWLHRWVSLILVIQVLLWLVSGLYFALAGNASMSGRQYLAPATSAPALATLERSVGMADLRARFPSASSIRLVSIADTGQYQVEQGTKTHYIDARTGDVWQTSEALARRLALASYEGPGELARIEQITGSDEVHGWTGKGYRVEMDDDLNTRIYVDGASGKVLGHRNTPWVLGDWAFRLHFMDFSGGHNFNHLLIWTAGLLALWFSLSGLILLMHNLVRGDLNPLAKRTWLEHLQHEGTPVPSGCGGGGSCGLCKVTMTGEAVPAPSAAGRALLSDGELEAGIRLSCQHRTSSAYEVEVDVQNVSEHSLTLASSRALSPSIVELTFDSDATPAYQAGQFMQFHIPHVDGEVLRHYSMATRPMGNRLVFNVRRMPAPKVGLPPGVGSHYLCDLKPGDRVTATGPFGDFRLTEHNQATQLFIGGGAGIAPLRALLQVELAGAQPRDCVFFYGARNEDELCYREELEESNALSYQPVLSELDEHAAWAGLTGFVHEAARQWLATQQDTEVDVYVCGPPPMLKATLAMLAEQGVAPERIRYDDFGI